MSMMPFATRLGGVGGIETVAFWEERFGETANTFGCAAAESRLG